MRHLTVVLCLAATLVVTSGCGSTSNNFQPATPPPPAGGPDTSQPTTPPPPPPPAGSPEGQPSKPPERHTIVVVSELELESRAIATYDFNVETGVMRFLDRRASPQWINDLITVPGTRRVIVNASLTAEVDSNGKIGDFVPLFSVLRDDPGFAVQGIVHPSGNYFYIHDAKDGLHVLDLSPVSKVVIQSVAE